MLDDRESEIRGTTDGKGWKVGRNGIAKGSVAAIGVAVVIALVWLSGDESQNPGLFRIVRLKGGEAALSTNNVISDFFCAQI